MVHERVSLQIIQVFGLVDFFDHSIDCFYQYSSGISPAVSNCFFPLQQSGLIGQRCSLCGQVFIYEDGLVFVNAVVPLQLSARFENLVPGRLTPESHNYCALSNRPFSSFLGPRRWLRSRCATVSCIPIFSFTVCSTSSFVVSFSVSGMPWKRRLGRREYCSRLSASASKMSSLSSKALIRLSFMCSNCFILDIWCPMTAAIVLISNNALCVLIPFSSTYLCESGFSCLLAIKPNARSRLKVEC